MEIKIKEKERIINEEKIKNEKLEKKIKEIQNIPNNNIQINEISKLEEEIKQLKSYILSPGEKLIYIKFISVDQNINFPTVAKATDEFLKIESILYRYFPKYKETENYFLVNGKKINNKKTIEDNKIKNNDIITLSIFDNE